MGGTHVGELAYWPKRLTDNRGCNEADVESTYVDSTCTLLRGIKQDSVNGSGESQIHGYRGLPYLPKCINANRARDVATGGSNSVDRSCKLAKRMN